jgi:hypothetical protein
MNAPIEVVTAKGRNSFAEPSGQNRYLDAHVARLLNSFRHWTGRELIGPHASREAPAKELFYAPFAVLSHDTGPEPILNYGNQTALRLFGLTWDEIIVMPSRLTAQAPAQAERAELLARVSKQGFTDDYRGVRITKSGRRFLLERATVWNLLDESGAFYGQAATFSEWTFLD